MKLKDTDKLLKKIKNAKCGDVVIYDEFGNMPVGNMSTIIPGIEDKEVVEIMRKSEEAEYDFKDYLSEGAIYKGEVVKIIKEIEGTDLVSIDAGKGIGIKLVYKEELK